MSNQTWTFIPDSPVDFVVWAGESQCNTLQVPATPGTYEVLINETDIFATSQVQVLGSNLITFVQTDKPIYKPGQKGETEVYRLTNPSIIQAKKGETKVYRLTN